MIFKILNDNIKRSDSLGNWKSHSIYEYEYWDIRFVLPYKMKVSVNEVINYIVKKYNVEGEVTEKQKFSFYFWLKDGLEEIAKREIEHLTSRSTRRKTKYIPSPRAKRYNALVELNVLSGGDPLKEREIKKMKYAEIFDCLLGRTVANEGHYDTKD